MTKYILAYHGGEKPSKPELQAALYAKWNAWAKDLGDTLIEPGNPLGNAKTVSAQGVSEGGGSNPLIGYSVIIADDLDGAVEIAQSCPHLEMKGATMEVAEIHEM